VNRTWNTPTVHFITSASTQADPTIGDRAMEEFLALLVAQIVVVLAETVMRQMLGQLPTRVRGYVGS
jgi:hypothetical protein